MDRLSNSICCAQNGKCNINAPSVNYLLLYPSEHEYKSINALGHRLPDDVYKLNLLGRLRRTRWLITSAWPSCLPLIIVKTCRVQIAIVATSRKCLQNDISLLFKCAECNIEPSLFHLSDARTIPEPQFDWVKINWRSLHPREKKTFLEAIFVNENKNIVTTLWTNKKLWKVCFMAACLACIPRLGAGTGVRR